MTEKLCELAPIQERGIFGSCHFRRLSFEGGQVLPGHEHNFDHATLVQEGTVAVVFRAVGKEPWEEIHPAGDVFTVPAKVGHEIRALTERAVIFCIFAARDQAGRVATEITDDIRRNRFWHFRAGHGE
jgi:quercetin dioxygenase-like cupin family protein